MTISFDKTKDELTFSSGKTIYCFGGNPSIGLYHPETTNYSYGSDGGFYIATKDFISLANDISINEALELADAMIKTWVQHKEYLLKQLDFAR